MSKTRLICLLALPRTGSSYLCDLMSAHPQVESHSELFHRRAVFLGVPERSRLVPYFAGHLHTELTGYDDPRLVEFAHRVPQEFLQILSEQTEKPLLFFKVFPRHLDWQAVESALLSNREVHKVLLYRDPLQTFVSYQLGRLSDTWSHQDTTSIQVDVDVDEFLAFTDRNQAWQLKCEDALRKMEQPYVTLQYETLRALGSNIAVMEALRGALESLGIELDPVNEAAFDSMNIRPIQNRRERIRESVKNFDEVAHRLQQRGRAELIARHLN